jgi:DNA modification methylase
MGNCKSYEEFFDHFSYMLTQLVRLMKPGRNVSFHCFQVPLKKERDGVIGLRDFRGDLIDAFKSHGFVLHSEVVIWKDPVTQMQRTKALGLLHKTVRENATMSRQGLPDYLITMRAPGEVPQQERVTHDPEQYPVSKWQRIASPIWADIDPNDTLQYQSAREDDDERHICPLQLEVIRRGIDLWTLSGDVVFSPYAGIGSEVYVANQMGRRGVGVELKASYYRQAAANLQALQAQSDMFGAAA